MDRYGGVIMRKALREFHEGEVEAAAINTKDGLMGRGGARAGTMLTLRDALDKESYEWMSGAVPEVLDALEREVAGGRTPEQVKLFVLKHTGRLELALRCEQAARHLVNAAA